MEIRRWRYYVIVNCLFISYLEAKTFSLNEVITAESQQKEVFQTTLPPGPAASVGKRTSLIKRLKSTSRVKKFLESDFFDRKTFVSKKLSPLKYKKTFLIKSPLKPRRLKLIQKSRYKRKNQSAKHEINGNEKLKQKYIPLLKSLSMLFDNLLNSDSSESHEVKTKKFKRNRFFSQEAFEIPIDCSHPSNTRYIKSNSQEETATVSPTLTIKTTFAPENLTLSEASSATANYTTARNFSAFRQNKNIPILLPRNTPSSRRNDNGIGERSSTTLHRNIEGNITRYYGDHEHVTRSRQNESRTENDEENTNSTTRDGPRSFRFRGATRNRNNTRIFPKRNFSENKTTDDNIREIHVETGRNETKSPRVLQESIRRLRGFGNENLNQSTESIQSKEVREESITNVSHDNTSHQRIPDRGSSASTEDQKVRKGNETKIEIINSANLTQSPQISTKKKSPMVMIFDGYSVARHKNGENKFAEKSIRVHT